MAQSFKDHFSKQAASYATFRPKSPKPLFEYLVKISPGAHFAWDVGTGNGQVATDLAKYFDKVMATDASAEQIKHAELNPKVTYRIAPAEALGEAPEKAELITVGQAIHWFDLEKFYPEVRRIAAPGAVIAVWSYKLANITPEIDEIVLRYYDDEIGRFWPPERKIVDADYKTIGFPFRELQAPAFDMAEPRTLEQWAGYLYSWSATQKAIAELGTGLFDSLVARMEAAWGDPTKPRLVKWPLALRVGYV